MKAIAALILAIAVIFCLALTCAAAEEPEDPTTTEIVEEETAPPATEPEPEATPEAEPEAASFEIVDWFYANLDKLFSGSCLAVGIAVAYCFRKKLLPTIAGFVTQIMTVVSDIKKGAAESQLMQSEDLKKFFDKVSPILDEVHNNADACKKALEIVEQTENEREAMIASMQEMSSIILAMIEASRLPESVKEKARLGEVNTKKLVDSLRATQNVEISPVSADKP